MTNLQKENQVLKEKLKILEKYTKKLAKEPCSHTSIWNPNDTCGKCIYCEAKALLLLLKYIDKGYEPHD